MENEKFLVESGLYDKVEIRYEDYSDLKNLLSGKEKIDLFCSKCKEKRTFTAKSNKIKLSKKYEPITENIFDTYGEESKDDKDIYSSLMAQEAREKQQEFECFLAENKFTVLHYACSRDESHQLIFILFIDGFTIQKIGQYPSYADIDIPQANIYRKELGEKYYNELKRAIGLYSCNVGIGSYVHLRRIVEKLILDALKEAINEGTVTQEQFELDENKHQRRVEDKIKLLSNYLPKPLVDNKTVYGIISKGIHELEEDECLKYFPVVEQLITMCLDESIAKKQRKKDEIELKKKLSAINTEIKGKTPQ